jgi:hypothetical protein
MGVEPPKEQSAAEQIVAAILTQAKLPPTSAGHDTQAIIQAYDCSTTGWPRNALRRSLARPTRQACHTG